MDSSPPFDPSNPIDSLPLTATARSPTTSLSTQPWGTFAARDSKGSLQLQLQPVATSPVVRHSRTKLAIFSRMKWFKKKRSPVLKQDQLQTRQFPEHIIPPASDFINKLPAALLEQVFSFVCPHSQDESYESCEQSAVEDTCMSCDLRDLAHCAQVSRKWRKLAAHVLYVCNYNSTEASLIGICSDITAYESMLFITASAKIFWRKDENIGRS